MADEDNWENLANQNIDDIEIRHEKLVEDTSVVKKVSPQKEENKDAFNNLTQDQLEKKSQLKNKKESEKNSQQSELEIMQGQFSDVTVMKQSIKKPAKPGEYKEYAQNIVDEFSNPKIHKQVNVYKFVESMMTALNKQKVFTQRDFASLVKLIQPFAGITGRKIQDEEEDDDEDYVEDEISKTINNAKTQPSNQKQQEFEVSVPKKYNLKEDDFM